MALTLDVGLIYLQVLDKVLLVSIVNNFNSNNFNPRQVAPSYGENLVLMRETSYHNEVLAEAGSEPRTSLS